MRNFLLLFTLLNTHSSMKMFPWKKKNGHLLILPTPFFSGSCASISFWPYHSLSVYANSRNRNIAQAWPIRSLYPLDHYDWLQHKYMNQDSQWESSQRIIKKEITPPVGFSSCKPAGAGNQRGGACLRSVPNQKGRETRTGSQRHGP